MTQPLADWSSRTRRSTSCWPALGVERSGLPVELYDNGIQHVYVALASEEDVRSLRPDLGRLAGLPAVIGVNCFAGSGTRWKTRMFAPGDGVPEDPATGSAAGPLALHLARHGRIAFGDEIEISQGAEIGRPSTLYARVDGQRRARSRRSRSAARRSWSRAASSRLALDAEGDGLDLGQLERRARARSGRRRVESAEAVARRVEDEVGVVRGDRDRAARRQPAAGLAPGRPASCETTSGGRRSTSAITVEPEATQATTTGSETGTSGGGSMRAPASSSSTPSSRGRS